MVTADDPAGATSSRNSFRIVAIAASAGGVVALQNLVAELPGNFPVPVVIVQHVDPRHRSLLAEILRRRAAMAVEPAVDGAKMEPATIYIARPDQHLLVNREGTLSLTHSELVHFVRPSADLLFESVAGAYESSTIALVLTGTGADGAMGVEAVKKTGGTVIAQDEATSEYFGMPSAAIATGCVDFVLPLDEIAPALVTLVTKTEESAMTADALVQRLYSVGLVLARCANLADLDAAERVVEATQMLDDIIGDLRTAAFQRLTSHLPPARSPASSSPIDSHHALDMLEDTPVDIWTETVVDLTDG